MVDYRASVLHANLYFYLWLRIPQQDTVLCVFRIRGIDGVGFLQSNGKRKCKSDCQQPGSCQEGIYSEIHSPIGEVLYVSV